MQGTLEIRHVRRRLHPRQSGLVVQHGAMPPRRRHDDEIGVQRHHIIGQSRQFAERHAIAHGDRHESGERRIGIAHARAHITLHRGAAYGIGPVEDDHVRSGTRRGAHQLYDGGDVRVVAGPDVLQVDEQDVDRIERRRRRATRSAIETVDWKPGRRISAVGQARAIFAAEKAVLGTEQDRESYVARRAQQIDVAAAEVIDAGVVCEETEPLAGNQVRRIRQQDFDARADLGGDE